MLRRTRFVIVLAAFSAAVGATVFAQGRGVMLVPKDVKWPPPAAGSVGTSGAAGIQTVVVKGDPAKPGLYTLLLRVGPNQKIAAHMHGDDRVATVISGTWYLGYGRQFSEQGLRVLPAGSVYTEPPNVHHFAMTKDEGATVQITGMGPSSTSYANPEDDPARKR
ncbi:MAG: cupin domain-containing protein [Vicinamibacterales bacterium]